MSNADIEMSLCLGNIEIMMCFFSKLNVKIGKNVKNFKLFRFFWDAGGAEEARDVFTEVRIMGVELDNVKVAHVIKACANVSHTSNTFFSGMNVKRFISRILMAMFCLEMGGSAEICELLTEKRAKGVEQDIITLANVSTTGAMAGTLRKGKHVQSQIAFIVKEMFIFPALAKALQPIENTEIILLTVKPSYAYGEQGQPTSSCTGAIPTTATLHLVLELVIRKIASEIWNDMKIIKRVFDARQAQGGGLVNCHPAFEDLMDKMATRRRSSASSECTAVGWFSLVDYLKNRITGASQLVDANLVVTWVVGPMNIFLIKQDQAVKEVLLRLIEFKILIHWLGRPPEDPTGNSFESFSKHCPTLHLEDKVDLKGERIDTTLVTRMVIKWIIAGY
ncbi:hypothetical protein J5N97_002707 [Dioscorea zingiberensis]|uniref:peptidylprolyl isomerase n=1 Tax=Dioscorea zingiberensis TaxID=325984 RepID=A0A9D5D2S7_9LILI|nr:hypothetical protein J5N97_002707 [Dioscorea zingiberensis]